MPAHHSRNIALTPQLSLLVDELVASGEYRSASEVVRDGLRLLKARRERHEAELDEIRSGILKGLAQADRGAFVEGTADDILEASLERAGKRVRDAP